MPHAGTAVPTILVLLYVVGRFLMRELRERRISLGRIYVGPAILGISSLAFVILAGTTAPHLAGVLAAESLLAIGIGAGIGLAVARFTRVRLSHEPGRVLVLGDWRTIAIWLAALALRWAARLAVPVDDRAGVLTANAALLVLVAAALAVSRYRVAVVARELGRARDPAEVAAV